MRTCILPLLSCITLSMTPANHQQSIDQFMRRQRDARWSIEIEALQTFQQFSIQRSEHERLTELRHTQALTALQRLIETESNRQNQIPGIERNITTYQPSSLHEVANLTVNPTNMITYPYHQYWMMERLLLNGADPNSIQDGCSVITCLANNQTLAPMWKNMPKDRNPLRLLIAYGADLAKDSTNPLLYACERPERNHYNLALIHELLSLGANPKQQDITGLCPHDEVTFEPNKLFASCKSFIMPPIEQAVIIPLFLLFALHAGLTPKYYHTRKPVCMNSIPTTEFEPTRNDGEVEQPKVPDSAWDQDIIDAYLNFINKKPTDLQRLLELEKQPAQRNSAIQQRLNELFNRGALDLQIIPLVEEELARQQANTHIT